VVENGTAKILKSNIYKVAGKTGTAQIAKGGIYKRDGKAVYQASFVGYFPADKPKYSCIIMVSAPSGGEYYGAQVAAPIFKDIADKIYSASLDIHKQLNAMISRGTTLPATKVATASNIQRTYQLLKIKKTSFPDAPYVKQLATDSVNRFVAHTVPANKKIVPNVCGMTLKDALPLLENLGLHVKIIGSGSVKKQSIPSGTTYLKGTQITIELS
jgi:cell division protein FtsI (penicillin-binding protein 3)